MRSEKAQGILQKVRERETPYEVAWSGLSVSVERDVYPTGELSDLVVACLKSPSIGLKEGDSVLDYGTGTGFLAVAAAHLKAGKVVALDLNPAAVSCAQGNVDRHGYQSIIEVRQSDCLGAIKPGEKFDIILAGMPFESAEVGDLLERSVYDPNFVMRKTLFESAAAILNPGGRILTTYSARVQEFQPIESFSTNFYFERVGEREIKGETNYVYQLIPKGRPVASPK